MRNACLFFVVVVVGCDSGESYDRRIQRERLAGDFAEMEANQGDLYLYSYRDIVTEALEKAASADSLKSLVLEASPLAEEGVSPLSKSLTLTSLTLNCKLGQVELEQIRAIPNLKHLAFVWCSFPEVVTDSKSQWHGVENLVILESRQSHRLQGSNLRSVILQFAGTRSDMNLWLTEAGAREFTALTFTDVACEIHVHVVDEKDCQPDVLQRVVRVH